MLSSIISQKAARVSTTMTIFQSLLLQIEIIWMKNFVLLGKNMLLLKETSAQDRDSPES